MWLRNNKKTLTFFQHEKCQITVKGSSTCHGLFTFECLKHVQQDAHIQYRICTKKRGLSSPDHWKTLRKKKREREREETGLSFEVVCSTLGISVSIYYLWFHFICVTPSFPCIRRTTSFALMSEAEISWLCSGDLKNLWTDSQIQIMISLAQCGQWDMLKFTL